MPSGAFFGWRPAAAPTTTLLLRGPALFPGSSSIRNRPQRGSASTISACAVPPRRPGNSSSSPPMSAQLIATSFLSVQEPALFSKTYSTAVMGFVDAAILAYECGYSEEGLRQELQQLAAARAAASSKARGECSTEAAARAGSDSSSGSATDAGATGSGTGGGRGSALAAAAAALALDAEACLLGMCLVWTTLIKSPKAVTRWAAGSPVTQPTLERWQGFVSMIVDAYFNRRMAWYPLDKLQLELNVVQGTAGRQQHDVAELARIVFTTLERTHPQFPSM